MLMKDGKGECDGFAALVLMDRVLRDGLLIKS